MTLALEIGGVPLSPFTIVLVATAGGIGLAAALLTYIHSSPPKDGDDKRRQDALDRFKIWVDFWKYFLVSFALVLITTLLGNALKERELALAAAKDKSAVFIAENSNLGSFLKEALAKDWEEQYQFASYFSYVTRDDDARGRWKDYASFIEKKHNETAQAQTTVKEIVAETKQLTATDPKRIELEKKLNQLQSTLELNKVLLQPKPVIDVTFFSAGLGIDVSGAPNAYNADDSLGLEYLSNAGKPGSWYGLVTDEQGKPVVQGPNDPAPGFYIAPTALRDEGKQATDPSSYVDSNIIPYVVLSAKEADQAGIRLGDFAAVLNSRNQQLCYAIYADTGPAGRYGEGSISLAKNLGVPANAKHAFVVGGIIYKIFPGSGNGKPRSLEEINREGERLLKAWGGKQQMLARFKDISVSTDNAHASAQ